MKKARQLLFITLFFYLLGIPFIGFTKTYSLNDLEIASYLDLSHRELQSLENDINKMKAWWSDYLGFSLQGQFIKVHIFSSVKAMQKTLKLPYWIGGWYQMQTIYLQPLWVLKKKHVYQKILFIEYAHFVLESYLGIPLPSWLGEVIPFFLYYRYSAQLYSQTMHKNIPVKWADFQNLLKQLYRKQSSRQFFSAALYWFQALEKKYGKNFILKFLKAFQKHQTSKQAIQNISGKTWKLLYQKFSGLHRDKGSKDFIFFR